MLYRITRRDLVCLDSTEGVPGRGYRHVEVEDCNGRVIQPVSTKTGSEKSSTAAGNWMRR